MTYPDLHLFVAGEWIAAGRRDTIPVLNPASGEVIGMLPMATAADLDRAAASAADAFKSWRRTSPMERSRILRDAARLMRERMEADARTMTLEQGKPLAQSRSELAASADCFDWYAEEGRRAYGRVIPARNPDAMLTVLREPVGPVAAFTPWNFPASQVARKLAPALAAGCTCVVKPSEETPGSALAIIRALDDVGLPKGVLHLVFGVPGEVAEHLIAAPEIRKVSFTGSTQIGKLIGKLAADGVKRTTLELGGHAPVIIFDDADIEAAAKLSAAVKTRNAGQACISPTRFLVQDAVHDRFVAAFKQALEAVTIGDGLDKSSDMGPLANKRRVDAMDSLTLDAVAQGGVPVLAGKRIGNAGNFWSPTLIADAPLTARANIDEPFGPFALTRRFSRDEEAIAEANRLPYGLAAYAFTKDRGRAGLVRREVESGLIGINSYAVTWPETPFGGVKESGYGSEGGAEGLDVYLSVKFISEV